MVESFCRFASAIRLLAVFVQYGCLADGEMDEEEKIPKCCNGMMSTASLKEIQSGGWLETTIFCVSLNQVVLPLLWHKGEHG